MATKKEKDIVRKVLSTYGKRGGKKTLALHGKEHFRNAALKMHKKKKAEKQQS